MVATMLSPVISAMLSPYSRPFSWASGNSSIAVRRFLGSGSLTGVGGRPVSVQVMLWVTSCSAFSSHLHRAQAATMAVLPRHCSCTAVLLQGPHLTARLVRVLLPCCKTVHA
eukprot:Tamp_34115.p2 GENE.Tamp_34115~~Tamp_34115.p2  ORF type:complete len:112 (+),score=5.46 Tamp_34115:90-425(+)